MIIAHNLSKYYGKIKALDQASLKTKPGEICGILGPNGAGKTTLFKILCGFITADAGNFSIQSDKPKPVGAIIEKPALFEYISARQNLAVLSRMQDAPDDHTSLEHFLELVGLSVTRNDPVKHFSLGMKQRLGLATALINDPDCLILDEPFLGLDPVAMEEFGKLLRKLAQEQHLTILISSHLLGELTRTCDTLKVMQSGKIIASGPTKEILQSSTKRFMICGRDLQESRQLGKYPMILKGDCASIKLEVKDASHFLKLMVEEGNEITYFGPEMNLTKLYGEE